MELIRKKLSGHMVQIIVCIIIMASPVRIFAYTFHTPPDKWREPRIFHLPLGSLEGRFADNVHIDKLPVTEIDTAQDPVSYSGNGAYYYYIPDHRNKRLCRQKNCPIILYIYNERDYLISFTFTNIFNSASIITEWVNEKIIYIEPWLDKENGFYILYDAESEKIIQSEAIKEGSSIFHLWNEDCNNQGKSNLCLQ